MSLTQNIPINEEIIQIYITIFLLKGDHKCSDIVLELIIIDDKRSNLFIKIF